MMKNPTKLIALLSGAALLSASLPLVSSAQTVATDPVGYITLTVGGTGGVGSEAVSVLGAPLENAAAYQGALDASTANTLTDNDAAWTVNEFATSYYVQISSGANEGVSATIIANTATELTTAEDLSSLLAGDESYVIRSYTTIADVFGAANEGGIGSGANLAAADEVLLYNGSSFDFYYYQEGAAFGGEGWRSSVNAFTDASTTPIPFGLAVVVKRKQSADVQIVISGSVIASDAVIPVENDVNWISSALPVDYTLAGFFGADGGELVSGASLSAADEVLVPNASGGYDFYYYQEGAAFGGDGWRSSTNAFTDASATPLSVSGTGFVLKRKGAAYNQVELSPL